MKREKTKPARRERWSQSWMASRRMAETSWVKSYETRPERRLRWTQSWKANSKVSPRMAGTRRAKSERWTQSLKADPRRPETSWVES